MHVFEATDAFLVEFVNPADGSTRALAELTPDQLAPAGALQGEMGICEI